MMMPTHNQLQTCSRSRARLRGLGLTPLPCAEAGWGVVKTKAYVPSRASSQLVVLILNEFRLTYIGNIEPLEIAFPPEP